jgi:hypothetical protein
MRRHPFPEYPLRVSDKSALFAGIALFAFGGFTIFVLLPAAVRGLFVGEGWAQVFSGALLLLILALIATTEMGKVILILFTTFGGLFSIVTGVSESSDALLLVGIALFVITYFLYSILKKD